jgi:protein involved in polysaccharide export with SLBB domain
MARMYGSNGQVLIDKTGAVPGTPVVVASLSKWTVNMTKATADVTSFGDTNKVYVLGLPDLKGTIGGFFDSADTTLLDCAAKVAPVTLKLTPNSTIVTPGFFWTGLAYVDATIDVPAVGAVAITGNFVAAGAWTRTPTPTMLEAAA